MSPWMGQVTAQARVEVHATKSGTDLSAERGKALAPCLCIPEFFFCGITSEQVIN
jgi:hypothetical protein